MSEKTDDDDENRYPSIQTFEITTTRTFEMDFSATEIRKLIEQTGETEPREAIASMMASVEYGYIKPEQKLLAANVNVKSPSDD